MHSNRMLDGLWKLPIDFFVENNMWAIGMFHIRMISVLDMWEKGPAFGVLGVHVGWHGYVET